jgi:hypothetical protein
MTGGWKKLRNEELHHLYSSASVIRVIKSRRIRGSRHVARRFGGGGRNAYRMLMGKPEGKRSLGRTR